MSELDGPPYVCKFTYCNSIHDDLKGLKSHLSTKHGFNTLTQQQILRDWEYIEEGKKEFRVGGLKITL